MIKTQVQIPNELYRRAKQVAAERDWSFAEVVRRGLEYIPQVSPPGRAAGKKWRLPPQEWPKIVRGAAAAAAHCQAFRENPNWHLVEGAPVMDEVWHQAASKDFAVRGIIDARLALTLRHHGVTESATTNQKDFAKFGFARVCNPLNGQ